MKRYSIRKASWLPRAVLSGVTLFLLGSPVAAQGVGGGGGGLGGTGGAGLTTGGRTGIGGGTGIGGMGGGFGTAGVGTGATGRTGTGATVGGPQASNPFQSFYSSALAAGLGTNVKLAPGGFTSGSDFVSSQQTGSAGGAGGGAGGTGGGAGGRSGTSSGGLASSGATSQNVTAKAGSLTQPLFAVTTTGTTATGAGTTGGRGTTGGIGGAGTAGSFNTLGQRRAPSYTVDIGFKPPPRPATPAVLQSSIQQKLSAASTLNGNGQKIQVAVSGSTVLLRGNVGSERERRVAEAMVRLNPGVRDVINQLEVPPPPASSNGGD